MLTTGPGGGQGGKGDSAGRDLEAQGSGSLQHRGSWAREGRGRGLGGQGAQIAPGLRGHVQDLGLHPESKGGGVAGLGVCDQTEVLEKSSGCYVKKRLKEAKSETHKDLLQSSR